MGYKSKFKGAEIDKAIESIYFYTIPVEVMEKIYNYENLSLSEGVEIYKNALRAYKIVFPDNILHNWNLNQFYELGYIEAASVDDVHIFDLQQIIFDVVDGEVTMRAYVFRFTREGDHFTVAEL